MPIHNSLIDDRHEAAGLQIVGKVTLQGGIMGVTEPAMRTMSEPWNTDHTQEVLLEELLLP